MTLAGSLFKKNEASRSQAWFDTSATDGGVGVAWLHSCCWYWNNIYITRSHKTKNTQSPLAAKNVYRAVLGLSVARFSSLFPLPTSSTTFSESATSWSRWEAWTVRLFASVVCSSAISTRDFSAVL